MAGDLRPSQRAPLLALGFVGLLLGVTAGLARLGYRMPDVSSAASAWHGPLMIGGFFGVVIALERAVAIGRYVAYLGPLLGGLGSLAIAIGNPLGFENSATAGIISGSQRAIPGAASQAPALVDLIQTDAAISPGNSGGALVDADMQVIGINVAYIPPSAGSVSIGFAIPAPTVTDVVTQLLEDGTADHAYLGVLPAALTPEIVQQFDIPVSEGALIVEVPADGPAADAGIQPGDVITAIGDTRVATVEDLLGALRRHKPGDKVSVTIVRNGEESTVDVTLGDFPRVAG